MKLNCKPGDLAVIVRSKLGNEGRIVRCLHLDPMFDACWVIDKPIGKWGGKPSARAWDSYLRPIGNPNDDAQDETLSWLPVPSREEVAQ